MSEHSAEKDVPHTLACDDEGCYCPDDVFWGRLLGDDDPCAPGKDWAAAAFTEGPIAHDGFHGTRVIASAEGDPA